MEFRTEVPVPEAGFSLKYKSGIMMQGSCFTVNIGNRLKFYGFNTHVNTCGIIFNPVSVYKALDIIMSRKFHKEEDLILHNGIWISLNHHGSFSDINKDRCLEKINREIDAAHESLKNSSALFITWGTSIVYEHNRSRSIAANCHRLPAGDFKKYRYSTDSIVHIYTELLERLYTFNPSLKIIFTVSPVRHWRDGAVENQRSKAALHLAVDELTKKFDFASYFPAYEIVMDDLRDYRFYADDMIHPAPAAIEYIWDKFASAYIDKKEIEWMKRIEKIRKGLDHRSSGASPDEYREFLIKLQKETDEISRENPHIDVTEINEEISRKISGKQNPLQT